MSKIISDSSFDNLNNNLYVDKKYLDENNLRKISLKHIIEISSARIEEITNIIFNNNQNLYDFKNKEVDLYLDFEDKKIKQKF